MRRPMQENESHQVYDLYTLCQELHSLPKPGGIFDQDAVLMHLFLIIVALQREADANKKG